MRRLSVAFALLFYAALSWAQGTSTSPQKADGSVFFGWHSGGGAAVFAEIAGNRAIVVARCADNFQVVQDNSFSGSWNITMFGHGGTVSSARLIIFGSWGASGSTPLNRPCAGDFSTQIQLDRIASRPEAISQSKIDVGSVADYRTFYAQAYGAEPNFTVAEAASKSLVSAQAKGESAGVQRESQIKADEERRQREILQARFNEERRQREILQARLDEERRQREFQTKLDEERRQRELLQVQLDEERRKRELQAKLEAERQQQEQNTRAEDARRQQEIAAKAAPAPQSALSASRSVRKALIIGNDSYTSVPRLRSARTDASAVEQAFISAGYAVSAHYDVNEREMKRVIREFVRGVEGGDEVMFFFAGHGVQLGGANYLLPTDIRADDAGSVRDEAISLQRVMDDFTETKARLTLAIIDACRDNPFVQAGRAVGGRGLAATNVASGQMIVFSAGAGQQALDTLGANDRSPNGLFTRVFLRHVRQKGVSIDRVMRQVRGEVMQLAKSVGHEQVPALYDQVVGDFYFVP